MAYSNTLSSAAPADTDLLSSGDDSIRTLAAALIERLLTVFTDLNAQPLVYIANTISASAIKTTSKVRSIVLTDHPVSGTIGAGAGLNVNIADVDAVVGDVVIANPAYSPLATTILLYEAHIVANGTIVLDIWNPTTAPITLTAQNFHFAIIKAVLIP